MRQALSMARRVVGWFEIGLAVTAAAGILALTVLAIVNVAIRNTSGGGIQDIVGVGEVAVAAVGLLGVAHAQRHGVHIRSTVLLDRLSPRLRDLAELVSLLLLTVLMAWVVEATTDRALHSVDLGESRFGVVPIWPARVLIALSLALLTVEFALQAFDRLLRLTDRGSYDESSGEKTEEPNAVEMPL